MVGGIAGCIAVRNSGGMNGGGVGVAGGMTGAGFNMTGAGFGMT